MKRLKTFPVLLLVLLWGCPIDGSLGDMDPHFRSCVNECRSSSCEMDAYISPVGSMQLVAWDCVDSCKYDCMTKITKTRLGNGYNVLKYNGHWPFNRLFGLEEPASVLFSALNLIPHAIFLVRCIVIYLRGRQDKQYYMSAALFCYAMCASNAWIASTLFHSKKTDFASLYDYVSAFIFLCSGLWVAFRRFIDENFEPLSIWAILLFGLVCAVFRVMQMIEGKISFDNHMNVCITIVIVTTIVWILWCLLDNKPFTSHKWICLGCQLWLIIASALEIFDFPPYFELFDAHSLWHAATIPLGFIWYDWFWKLDHEERSRTHKLN